MRRVLTALGVGLSGLLLLAAAALVLLPADRVARIAAQQIGLATGREVAISGDVSMTIWPVLGASVEGLEIGNADWARQGPMLSARNAALGVDVAALLRGEIRITHIDMQSPVVRLESRADGRANWTFDDAGGSTTPEAERSPDAAPSKLHIARIELRDATLIHGAEGADPVSYEAVDLALDWPDPDGPAQMDAVLRPAGTPVTAALQITGFARFLAGERQPVALSLAAGAGQASLRGAADMSGAASGDLSITATDTAGFLAALALPSPALPEGLGRSLDLRAGLELSAARVLCLTDMVADLGGNTLRGSLRAALEGVPRITASLSTDSLDLARAGTGGTSGSGAGAGAAGAAAQGWSTAPLDASGLSAFNGEITLAAQSVRLGALTFGRTRAVLTNERARMVFALSEVAAYGGALTGQFVINNRSGLSVGGDLTGRGIGLGGLLSDLAGLSRLTGAADASVEFLGVGGSVDAIMRSLRGSGRVAAGAGTIRGIDLDRLMRSGQGTGGTTVFDSLTASFALDDGVLGNDDLLMSLPNYEARGAGRVDLGAQTLDYLFTPKALRGNEGRGVAIPVRVRGPWAAPQIVPDLEAVVDLNFSEEKSRVQDKARDAVGERLGVERQEGQSLEDAIEDKLEEGLRDGLRRLFD